MFQTHFDVAETSKKQTLCSIGNKWKNFKHYLYKSYIKPIKEAAAEAGEDNPVYQRPDAYNFLTLEDWELFVSQRLSKRWQDKSKHGKRIREKNLYPHHLSRKGYVGLIQELV